MQLQTIPVILFVGTKKQAADAVAEEAVRAGQYFINHRWLGGTLTNWGTIKACIARLRKKSTHEAGTLKFFLRRSCIVEQTTRSS